MKATKLVSLDLPVPEDMPDHIAREMLAKIMLRGLQPVPSRWYTFGVKLALVLFGAVAMGYLMGGN